MASFLGWTLDAFDFFVLVFLIDTLAAHFHVEKRAIVATLTATLALRPVGALLFGLLADRYGRRRLLMANVVFFSLVELLCGFAPNFTGFLSCGRFTALGWEASGEWGRRWRWKAHRKNGGAFFPGLCKADTPSATFWRRWRPSLCFQL